MIMSQLNNKASLELVSDASLESVRVEMFDKITNLEQRVDALKNIIESINQRITNV